MTIPVNPNAPLTIQLHPNELDYIAKCLHTRPYGEVAPLLAKIQNQVILQQMPPEPEPEVNPAVSAPDAPNSD